MKYIRSFYWFIPVMVLFVLSACDSITDLNDNPNNPTEVSERLQLPALESNFSYEIIGNTAARVPAHWTQQLAFSGVPPSEDNYDFDESDADNLWQSWAYTDVLKNARILAEQAEANGNFGYAGIAKVIEAWTLGILTDLWGDVPYSEALDPEINKPSYDSQQEVYEAIFTLFDEAIADLNKDSGLAPTASSDFLYGGDLAKWEKLAYTLKARYLLHLTEAPGMSATEQATKALAALQNGFQSTADDADFAYYASKGAENPWFQWVIDGKWDTRNQLSEHYITLLKARQDPRLSIQARPVGAVDANGVVAAFQPDSIFYSGQPNGEEGLGAVNVSSIGAYYSSADASLNWISFAEEKFLEAEALLRTSGPAAAQPVLQEAIRANMQKLGIPTAEIEAFVASRPALTPANALQEIITEKYISNFLNLEVYNDWRRTGFPVLEPVTNRARLNIIPLRFPYPFSEISTNQEKLQETGIPEEPYAAMRIPVWWDTTP